MGSLLGGHSVAENARVERPFRIILERPLQVLSRSAHYDTILPVAHLLTTQYASVRQHVQLHALLMLLLIMRLCFVNGRPLNQPLVAQSICFGAWWDLRSLLSGNIVKDATLALHDIHIYTVYTISNMRMALW